jgi:hypothetical protein
MKELEIIDYYLTKAEECGLQVEFVTFALKYIKEDPGLTIEEACCRAYEEWVK